MGWFETGDEVISKIRVALVASEEMEAELSEANAEIDRLKKEVYLEKHKFTESEKVWVKAIDTAWNDAIEAAAELCQSKSEANMGGSEPDYYVALGYELAAEAILDLKRSQP